MIGKKLIELRNDKGETQKQVADKLKISRGTYAHYEIDRREPDLETLQKIAGIYNVSTDYLLGKTPRKFMTLEDITRVDPELGKLYSDENVKRIALLDEHDLTADKLKTLLDIIAGAKKKSAD